MSKPKPAHAHVFVTHAHKLALLKDSKELYCKINKKRITNYFKILLLHKGINKKFLLTSGHWRHDDQIELFKGAKLELEDGEGQCSYNGQIKPQYF
jgi:hypothetical protein